MILETLGFRSKASSTAERSDESIPDSNGRLSVRSNTTATSSFSSSPASNGKKRYSNNLFGSGRFRDYTYVRSVTQSRASGSVRGQSTLEPPQHTQDASYPDTLRAATPEEGHSDSNGKLSIRSAPLIPPAPYGEHPLSAAEYRLSKTLGPAVFKRASVALGNAIRELEEEAEDEIVMPRSAPILRSSFDQQRQGTESVCPRVIFSQLWRSSFYRRQTHQPSTRLGWLYLLTSRSFLSQKNDALHRFLPELSLVTSQECRDP